MTHTLADKFGLTYEQRKELRRVCEELFERYRFIRYEGASTFGSGLLAAEGETEQEEQVRDDQFAASLEYYVQKLPRPERDIIMQKYMNQEPTLNYRLRMDLGISEGTFDKRRYQSFVKLAEAFNLDYGAKSKILPETK